LSTAPSPMARLRPLLFLGIIILLVFVYFKTRKGEATSEAAVKRDIQKVLDDQVASWNMGDLDGFMVGYWQSEDLTFYSSKKTNGWNATFDRYRKRYQADGQEMGTLTFSDTEIEPIGPDTALVRGRWHLEFRKPEGWLFGRFTAKEPIGGLFTLIFKRKPQGWCIVHDHTSAETP
jgi:ketosteroid isomerase-like protein